MRPRAALKGAYISEIFNLKVGCINARLSLRATTPYNYSWKIPQDPTSQDPCFDKPEPQRSQSIM